MTIDLHVHTTASDGTLSPSEVVKRACDKALKAIAITDHDTVAGIDEALNAAADTELKVIPGVELSAYYDLPSGKNIEIHILGYEIDHKNESLIKRLEMLSAFRIERNKKICALFNEQDIPIDYDELVCEFKDAVLTRANFAKYLVDKGYVKDKDEAFKNYLSPNGPCYVPKMKISTKDACDIIKAACGIAVLAHPVLYKLDEDNLRYLIKEISGYGISGIEAIYSNNSADDELLYKQIAAEYGLFITGGSDFHGAVKPRIDIGTGFGNLKVPYEVLKNIISVE